MFRQKAFKVILAVMLLFSVLIIPVSASTVTGDNIIYPFRVAGIQIFLLDSSGNSVGIDVNSNGDALSEGRVRFKIKRSDSLNFVKGQGYQLLVSMNMNEEDSSTGKYYSGEYCVSAKYRMSISTTCAINVSQDNFAGRYSYGYTKLTEDGTYTYNAYNVVTVDYPYSDIGDSYYCYENRFKFTPNTTVDFITFNVYSVDFSAISSSERDALLIGENIDKNTDKVIANQDKNTQEIIENEKEMQEKEKAEANDTGAEGVGEISNIIPDESDGIVDAFKKLTKSMIHTDTDCNITFPSLKIPKIGDFWKNDIVLWEGGTIDFESVIKMIPKMYRNLIAALFNITIIIFCVREMYSQFKFIFTAKGGGDSE